MNLSLLSSLLKEKQFVVVDLTDKYLVFLVDDVEKPQVPGFPAMALEYYKELSDARQAIEDAYNMLNYRPKNKGHLDLYKSKTKTG